jgi:serine/threonine protein kinase
VRVIDDQLDGAPHCLLMDLVDGQKLDEIVQLSPPLPLRQIKTILLRLAEALAEAHQHRCLLRGLTPRNVRIDSRGEPRFSAFRFFSLLSEESVSPGTFLVSHEACTYMTPEHFEGRNATTASDQYSLGLIGYELLTGQRIPMVTRAADLLDKPALFSALERDERVAARSPELGGMVSKMLRVDPTDRWESMNEVVRTLENLSIASSRMDELREIAAKSYLRIQATKEREQRFYQNFYAALFECLPEVKAFFPNTSEAMENQYEALNKAIKVLLDFDPECEKSRRMLEAIARKHDRYKLTSRHLTAFHGTLLATLVVQGEADSGVQSAWNEIVQVGLRAMSSMLH